MLNVYYLKVPDYDTVPESGFCERISEETRKTAEGFRCEKVKRLKWLGEGMVRSLLENELQVRRGDISLKEQSMGSPIFVVRRFLFFIIYPIPVIILCAYCPTGRWGLIFSSLENIIRELSVVFSIPVKSGI